MGNPVVHWELMSKDPAKVSDFYDAEVEDPGAYTRPWSSAWELRWVGGAEPAPYFCQDNRS